MLVLNHAVLLTLFAASVHAIPVVENARDRYRIDGIHVTDDFILFDAPAFPNPSKTGETLMDVETFAFIRMLDFGSVISEEVSAFIDSLTSLGVDVAQNVQQLEQRVKFFLAAGLAGKAESVTVGGCSNAPMTGATELLPELGLSDTIVSLGQCGSARKATGKISLDLLDNRDISNTIYFSPNSGFGVISDVDDTVKISNVLNKVKLAEATFIDDPEPVEGMPELYSSLARSLSDPQFIYITGSPFQLYPFLNSFIKSTFSASAGPIWTRNLTITDLSSLFSLASGGNSTLAYKVAQIDRLHGMYPKKKWLAIGDSTESDPEVYGQIFNKYPGFIQCIWIRRVAGAANNQSRFDAAFRGVPQGKAFVYDDDQIPTLALLDVPNGHCTP